MRLDYKPRDGRIISIHAPRTGSDDPVDALFPDEYSISIHAPRTGSDAFRDVPRAAVEISIHAPRTGSDTASWAVRTRTGYFNPRSPHGERRGENWRGRKSRNFNPRSPHGERHYAILSECCLCKISIHAPRTGSDQADGIPAPVVGNFNPRSPHGERQNGHIPARNVDDFNPRSPHGERPLKLCIS